jgi:hypothetical protein
MPFIYCEPWRFNVHLEILSHTLKLENEFRLGTV